MKWRLVTRSQVYDDIHHAARWYDEQRQGLGDEFVDEVIRTFDSLQSDPLVHQVRIKSQNIRWIHTDRFPYRLIYRVIEPEQIIILGAVIHTARSRRTWQDRF